MRCPSCSHENPDTNKFCAECGAELVATCPSCSTSNPPSSKFCGECGTSLRAAATPATTPGKAERRLVSVLFADLVGFTPFSESRDPEEVRGLLTTYFDRSREIVERFGGEVDKFIGDAVMAVWGAVGAREDDAERSVRAALELVDMAAGLGAEIGVPELALRAGVMSGETSVGPGGNEKGLVVGDLVNTASRLQSIAEPGTVLVGDPTRGLTAASIAFEELGPQTVKGKETPVPAFRALRIISERGGARRVEGLEPPFTGRDVELRMLKDQFHATGRDRSARLVSVIGEAGIGKTRLSWELEKYMDGLAESVYWHRGRSPSYGEGLTMWALGEMVRSRSGISDTDDPAKSRVKLRTAVAEYVTSEEDRRWLEPRLAALLGLETATTGDREELYAAFRTFFQHISARGTTVLVFEDMHWADTGLLDFVTELVERSPRHPIFVVTLARPELLEARPGFGSGHRNSISMHLAPLSNDSMAELVSGMVPGLDDASVVKLVERAGGIPMYAVEFVRMLLAGGELVQEDDGGLRVASSLGDLALPESLQAVVGARLDRLPTPDRELIQDAAVLGQSFTADGLGIVRETDVETIRRDLAGLVRHQLLEIDDDPRSPERGQYRFVQSVIREVAYGRLSKADRFAKHLRVARYFEGQDTELVGAVASHYLAAHASAPAGEADGLLERGRTALADSAARAEALRSHEAALSLLTQALELATAPVDRAPLLLRASNAAFWASMVQESIDLSIEAGLMFDEIGDAQGRYRSLTLQAMAMSSNFRADEAVALLAPAYDSIGDPSTEDEVALALETARAYMLNGEYAESIAISDRVMARAETMLSPAQVIDGIITRGTALGRTRPIEGTALLMGAVQLSDQHDLQAQGMRAFNNLAVVKSFDVQRVEAYEIDEFLTRARRTGAATWLIRSLFNASFVHAEWGDLDRAEAMLDEMETFELNDFEKAEARLARAGIAVHREGTPDQLQEHWEAASAWDDSQDPQLQGSTHGFKAGAKALEGDFAASFEHAILDPSSDGALAATMAALMMADEAKISRAREFADRILATDGRIRAYVSFLLDAGAAAISGDTITATGHFLAALEMADRVVGPLWLATTQALAYGMVGDAHPAIAAAGREAASWLHEHGFRRWQAVLEDFLPPEESAASETA